MNNKGNKIYKISITAFFLFLLIHPSLFAAGEDSTADQIKVRVVGAQFIGKKLKQSTLIEIPLSIQRRNEYSSWMDFSSKSIEYGKLLDIIQTINGRALKAEKFLRALLQIIDYHEKKQVEEFNNSLKEHVNILSLFTTKEYIKGEIIINLKKFAQIEKNTKSGEQKLLVQMIKLISISYKPETKGWELINFILNHAVKRGPADYGQLTASVIDLKRHISKLQQKELNLTLQMSNQSEKNAKIYFFANIVSAEQEKKRWEILEPMKLIYSQGIIDLKKGKSKNIRFNSFDNAYYKTESIADNIFDPVNRSLKVWVEVTTLENIPQTFKSNEFIIGKYQIFQ